MAFEIWETSSSNLIGDFQTEKAALQAVRTAVNTHGRQYVMIWVLAYEDDQGDTTLVADGANLIELARAAPA